MAARRGGGAPSSSGSSGAASAALEADTRRMEARLRQLKDERERLLAHMDATSSSTSGGGGGASYVVQQPWLWLPQPPVASHHPQSPPTRAQGPVE